MKSNVLEYKGYHTIIETDVSAKVLRGKIEGINDYVDFESDNVIEIETEFHSAVDDYLNFCKEVGKCPEKEYKGIFNVRIHPESHRQLAMLASKEGITLNAVVERAIDSYVHDMRVGHLHCSEEEIPYVVDMPSSKATTKKGE